MSRVRVTERRRALCIWSGAGNKVSLRCRPVTGVIFWPERTVPIEDIAHVGKTVYDADSVRLVTRDAGHFVTA